MKRIREKLRSKCGETLVGILVAILIIALSAGLFAAMYLTSMKINLSAQEQDELLYEAVGTLEGMKESANKKTSEGQVQYKSESYSDGVDVEYFTQDGLSVYHDKE